MFSAYYSFLAVIVSLACILPTLLDFLTTSISESAKDKAVASLNSLDFKYSLVLGMGASFPIFLDFLADNLVWRKSSRTLTVMKGSAFNLIGLLILFLPVLIDFLIVIPNNAYYMHYSIFFIRVGCTCCVICSYLDHYGGHVWQHFLLKIAGLFLGCFAPAIRSSRIIGEEESYIFQYIAIAVELIGFSILFYLICKWYNYLKPKFAKGLSCAEYCCNVHLFCGLLLGIGIWVIELAFYTPYWYNRSSLYLASHECLFTLYFVMLTVYQGRATRREAAVFK
eukprot:gene11272-23585_t